MTMIPFRDGTGPCARVSCDSCGAEITIKTQHERCRGEVPRLVTGNAIRKLQSQGWSASATRQTCPACVAAKRSKLKEEPEMTATTDIPLPSRDQKREIMQMLNDVYDMKAQRYRGEESDHSVAHALGIERWGWVSQIRDEFFGPEGNEAKDNLIAEVKLKIRECDALGAKLHDEHDAIIKSLRHFNETRGELVKMLERLQGGKPGQMVAR